VSLLAARIELQTQFVLQSCHFSLQRLENPGTENTEFASCLLFTDTAIQTSENSQTTLV
jgi:hypothetical protein